VRNISAPARARAEGLWPLIDSIHAGNAASLPSQDLSSFPALARWELGRRVTVAGTRYRRRGLCSGISDGISLLRNSGHADRCLSRNVNSLKRHRHVLGHRNARRSRFRADSHGADIAAFWIDQDCRGSWGGASAGPSRLRYSAPHREVTAERKRAALAHRRLGALELGCASRVAHRTPMPTPPCYHIGTTRLVIAETFERCHGGPKGRIPLLQQESCANLILDQPAARHRAFLISIRREHLTDEHIQPFQCPTPTTNQTIAPCSVHLTG